MTPKALAEVTLTLTAAGPKQRCIGSDNCYLAIKIQLNWLSEVVLIRNLGAGLQFARQVCHAEICVKENQTNGNRIAIQATHA